MRQREAHANPTKPTLTPTQTLLLLSTSPGPTFSPHMFRRGPQNCLQHCPSRFFVCETSHSLNPFTPSQQLAQHRHLRLASPPKLVPNNPKIPRLTNPRNNRSMATLDPSTPASVNAAPPHGAHPVLSKVEESKRRAAYKAVEDHFDPSYKYIGIGSGSTVVYVVEAIASKGRDITSKMIFIPTGTNFRANPIPSPFTEQLLT